MFFHCLHGLPWRISQATTKFTIFNNLLFDAGYRRGFGWFFVGVIAPYWFNENYELSIGILLAGMVVAVVFLSEIKFKNSLHKMISIGGIAGLLLALSAIRIHDHYEELSGSELSVRNFYGTLKVFLDENGASRTMQHGQISHGTQYTTPTKALEPTTYYIPESGVGKAILIKKATSKSIKVGVVGLGVGTLAGYGRPEDTFRFYEINPQVIEVAKQKFTFLSKSPAKVDIVLGDARLQLEYEPSQQFDVLVIDAFSGDSVPIHLLTQEAFKQYFRHLKTDGILALHITNRFLDLRPVVKSASDQFGKNIRVVNYKAAEGEESYRSNWALVTENNDLYKNPHLINAQEVIVKKTFKPWKDDYSSLISVIK